MIQYLVEEAHQYDNNTDANFFVHLEHKGFYVHQLG